MNRYVVAFVFIFFLAFSAACSSITQQFLPASPTPTATATATFTPTPVPCVVQAESFVEDVEALFDDWDDATRLADNTARIALSGPVQQLQEIRRAVNDLDPPACAEPVQRAFISYMNFTIDGFLAFMAEEPHEKQFEDAQVKLDLFIREFADLKAGAMPYGPNTPVPTVTSTPFPTFTPEPTVTPTPPAQVNTDAGTVEVGDIVYLFAGDGATSQDTVKLQSDTFDAAYQMCAKPHATEVEVIGIQRNFEEGRYYFKVRHEQPGGSCEGWVPEGAVRPTN